MLNEHTFICAALGIFVGELCARIYAFAKYKRMPVGTLLRIVLLTVIIRSAIELLIK